MNPGCLTGILWWYIIYNPHITWKYNPLYTRFFSLLIWSYFKLGWWLTMPYQVDSGSLFPLCTPSAKGVFLSKSQRIWYTFQGFVIWYQHPISFACHVQQMLPTSNPELLSLHLQFWTPISLHHHPPFIPMVNYPKSRMKTARSGKTVSRSRVIMASPNLAAWGSTREWISWKGSWGCCILDMCICIYLSIYIYNNVVNLYRY